MPDVCVEMDASEIEANTPASVCWLGGGAYYFCEDSTTTQERAAESPFLLAAGASGADDTRGAPSGRAGAGGRGGGLGGAMKAVFILWILAVDVACAVMLVVFLLLPPNAWSQFAAVGLLLCSLNTAALVSAVDRCE